MNISDFTEYYREKLKKFYYPLGRSYPWHYLLFSNYRWYRKLTAGLWQKLEEPGFTWMRVNSEFQFKNMTTEDWRKK